MAAPDLIEPWRAWRGFLACGMTLRSPRLLCDWQPGEPQSATCCQGGRHRAPKARCACGIYGASEPYPALDSLLDRSWDLQTRPLLAECGFWGRVVVSDAGLRAERAYPLCLHGLSEPALRLLERFLCFFELDAEPLAAWLQGSAAARLAPLAARYRAALAVDDPRLLALLSQLSRAVASGDPWPLLDRLAGRG